MIGIEWRQISKVASTGANPDIAQHADDVTDGMAVGKRADAKGGRAVIEQAPPVDGAEPAVTVAFEERVGDGRTRELGENQRERTRVPNLRGIDAESTRGLGLGKHHPAAIQDPTMIG